MTHAIRSRRPRAVAAALVTAALLILGLPAVAGAACAQSDASQAFAQFGDSAEYTLAPGGSFEEGQHGWTFANASIVAGNESFNLVPGTHSLAIGPGGSAASPWVCVNGERPTFRLVVRRLSGESNVLNVSLRWINLLGVTVNTTVASLHGDSIWAPTPVLKLGNTMPLWVPGTSLNLGLVFSSPGGGSWAIDDVYIDPYSR
jgi:hypothetical protein